MKVLKMSILALFLTIGLHVNQTFAQSMSKSYKTVYVERTIKAPADQVWEALVGDYGKMANFSPAVYASNYENGSLKGVKGAERKCHFNANGTRWSHEQIKEVDHEKMVMKNIILDAAKFPLDLDNSFAYYRVKDNGDGTSTASYEFMYRTKPAFMTGLVKGAFKKQLNETLLGLDHYLTTGEIVNATKDNWQGIKKKHKAKGTYEGRYQKS